MARIVLAPRALEDIERLSEFLIESDPLAAATTANLLMDGIRVPKNHPLIGRLVERSYREVLISRGRSGYIVLYKYDVLRDLAVVLAIRHQRED